LARRYGAAGRYSIVDKKEQRTDAIRKHTQASADTAGSTLDIKDKIPKRTVNNSSRARLQGQRAVEKYLPVSFGGLELEWMAIEQSGDALIPIYEQNTTCVVPNFRDRLQDDFIHVQPTCKLQEKQNLGIVLQVLLAFRSLDF
jgi:hypothetical protein